MIRLVNLPEEILSQISSLLYVEELIALSLTSRLLYRVIQPRLRHHVALKRKYHTVSDRNWIEDSHLLGWFSVLAELLREDGLHNYVTKIKLSNCPWYWNELPRLAKSSRHETQKPYTEEDMTLVVRAALNSPWIYRNGTKPCGYQSNAATISQFVAEVQEGDMDNILAILLPLLPKLEHIELGQGNEADEGQTSGHWLGSVPGTVYRIAAQKPDPSRGKKLSHFMYPDPCDALKNLRSLRLDFRAISRNYRFGDSLRELLPWMALPSLRHVDAFELNGRDPMWFQTTELPRSHVQEIQFHNRHIGISLEAVVGLAKFCVGPCLIAQNNHRGRLLKPRPPRWTWHVVMVDAQGEVETPGVALP